MKKNNIKYNSESNKVKKCPFCGSYATSLLKESSFYNLGVESWARHCDDCFASGPSHKSILMPTKYWNTRAK